MNIFVVIQELKESSLLLCADIDKATAQKELDYQKSISNGKFRLAEIEVTNKRLTI